MFGWLLVCWDRCLDGCWGGWMDAGLFGLFVHQMSFPKNELFFRQTITFPKKEPFFARQYPFPKSDHPFPKKTLCAYILYFTYSRFFARFLTFDPKNPISRFLKNH
jgi:hypothetical protein